MKSLEGKMTEDVNGNRKLFWKEISNVKGGKVESCNIMKDGNGSLAKGEDDVRRIWKKYFEDLNNIDTQEQVAVHMCDFDGIRKDNYFGGEPIGRDEVEVRVGKLKNGKAEENGREWRLPGRLYAEDLVLCCESEEDLRGKVEQFVDVCRRRVLKVNGGKSKAMVMNEEDGFECEVYVDGMRLGHVSEFKYLACIFDESVTYGAECSRKVARGSRVKGAIRTLVNARDLQIECPRVLHEALLVLVFTYGSETTIWKDKERCRIKSVQMDNL